MLHDVDCFLYVLFDFLLWCQYETGCLLQHMLSQQLQALWGKATPVGFEPMRGDPIGLAGRRLNRSAKVSLAGHTVMSVCAANAYSLAEDQVPCRRATDPHAA